jgi:hypothetical protein
MTRNGNGEERDPGSGEARPVLSLPKGRDDEWWGFRQVTS